ncbi:MAG: hypothetical protein COV52_01685 [Gammaproteobacteria bacterium CG11_big_fil_rev_8_21_14_0_20_46_22]|nr:MAG: hypothetical protein COW05_05580 [Gammaproteobacteria bacterium CG12_big_fil_rev_8_21_14_0_65_46_12]PIR11825.1 MAG: hypothetical protein COV52_01685 [Gammaproteobacteria bacterium CG11_big_fil_rev_8_21_14_0_20_46_22]
MRQETKKQPALLRKLSAWVIIVGTALVLSIPVMAKPTSSHADLTINPTRQPDVKVLTWIGTISATDPYIQTIEKDCGVHIAYYEYKSNQDFLATLRNTEDHFDILIFSDAIYNVIADDIANPKGTLSTFSNHYYPIIKQHYLAGHYAPNVAFFLHSMTGFLYNPDNLPNLPKDTISQMFAQATGKYVTMINAPIEADFFLRLALSQSKQANAPTGNEIFSASPLDSHFFKSLYQGTNFIITNTPERIVAKKNFAFSYIWSGDALIMLRNNPGLLKYYIHPNLSYVSTDLIATLNENPRTVCVAHKLASEWFLTHEQNVTDYFSPYGKLTDPKNKNPQPIDPHFKAIFATWMQHLPNLPWIKSVDENTFNALITTWDKIKFEVSEQNKAD